MKRQLVNAVFRLGGFRPFHVLVRNRILILMYHRFSDEERNSTVSSDQFRQHLQYLKKHANPISLEDAVDALESEVRLPANPVVITIDDAYRDAYEIALPLLDEYKVKATLFAVTDFVDGRCWIWTDRLRFVLRQAGLRSARTITTSAGDFHFAGHDSFLDADRANGRLKKLPNDLKDEVIDEIARILDVDIPETPTPDYAPISWDQIEEMDSTNVRIESHTVTHPILTQVEPGQLDRELHDSKARLETMLGRSVRYFCYPNGDVNPSVADAVRRAGYEAALTTEFGFNRGPIDPFLVRRIYAPASLEDFAQCTSGFESFKQMARS